MRAIKITVIVMGVLIVAGLAVVLVTLAGRIMAGGEGGPQGFGEARVGIPPGARVVHSMADGGRLLVQLELATGGTRFLVIDAASGRLKGSIDLGPTPP
jgi:hypothetical protein